MQLKTTAEYHLYREAAAKSTQILQALHDAVKVGVKPREIGTLAANLCQEAGGKPNFLGVPGKFNAYEYATCISVNDAVLHGIPNSVPLKVGDIVKLDFGLSYKGVNTDHCCRVVVDHFLNKDDERLVKTARQTVWQAAQRAIAGRLVGDISSVLESGARSANLEVIKEYVGHGIGHTLHEEPQIPAFGEPKTGERLKVGQVLCVEAQFMLGSDEISYDDDGWTIRSADGKNTAMFEYMVVVGREKAEILTPTFNFSLTTSQKS